MFWEIFYKLCVKKNVSPNAVAKEINVSNSTTTKWKNGTMPNGEILIKLADYFDVSIDYLIGRSEQSTMQVNNNNTTISGKQENTYNSNDVKLKGIENEIVSKMKSMSETQKAELLLTACKMIEKENK